MDVRARFIESIEYLRKMGFFEEYSNLSSEEIFEKLKESSILLKYFGRKEVGERWMKKSVFEVDSLVATYDRKRVWSIDVERPFLYPGMCIELLNKLASISRGVFTPTDVEEDFPRELIEKRNYLGGWYSNVYFTSRGKRHRIEFSFKGDFLEVEVLIKQVNDLIEDTGYQYYDIPGGGQAAFLVVFTEDEVDKLIEERGWKLVTVNKKGRFILGK